MNQHALARRLCSVLLLSFCPVPVPAQTTAVTGIVTDPSGAFVANARVTLKCGTSEHSTRSAADGSFSAPAGSSACRLRVIAEGFESVTRDVTILPGQAPAPQDVALVVARAATRIEVVADSVYVGVEESTGAKTRTPVIEMPQAISVVTHEQLAERGVQTLGEALRYTPGVSVETWGADSRLDWFKIRGFTEDQYGGFRDGLRWPTGLGRAEPYGIEEVEVLKGPSSVLYGQNAPGGLVNMVTKRPPAEVMGEAGLQFGSYGHKQAETDFGGPLDEAGVWRYRLTGLFRAAIRRSTTFPIIASSSHPRSPGARAAKPY